VFETELGCPSFHGEKMLKSRGANTHSYCVPLDIAKRSDNAPFDNLSFRVLVKITNNNHNSFCFLFLMLMNLSGQPIL